MSCVEHLKKNEPKKTAETRLTIAKIKVSFLIVGFLKCTNKAPTQTCTLCILIQAVYQLPIIIPTTVVVIPVAPAAKLPDEAFRPNSASIYLAKNAKKPVAMNIIRACDIITNKYVTFPSNISICCGVRKLFRKKKERNAY